MTKCHMKGLAIGLLLICVGAFGQSANTPQAKIAAIARQLSTGGLEMLEVMQIPQNAVFNAAISPLDLETLWHYRLSIKILGPKREASLVSILNTAVAQPAKRFLDVRWGIAFYSKNSSARIATLYFDKTGIYGAVDRTPVRFNAELLPRLQKALPLPAF